MRWMMLALAVALGASASAQELRFERSLRQTALQFEQGHSGRESTSFEPGNVSLGFSLGMTFNPYGVLITTDVDFWASRFLSVNLLLQAALGETSMIGVSVGPRLTFDFTDNRFSQLFKPYVSAGIGVGATSRIDPETKEGSSGAGGLLVLAAGIEYWPTSAAALGIGMQVSYLPTAKPGTRFFIGLRFIELRIPF